jgi:hypothetical protein
MLSSTNAIMLNEEFNKQNHNHNGITTLKLSLTSVLLVEETGVPGENHLPVANMIT